jgi:hypothetical protein
MSLGASRWPPQIVIRYLPRNLMNSTPVQSRPPTLNYAGPRTPPRPAWFATRTGRGIALATVGLAEAWSGLVALLRDREAVGWWLLVVSVVILAFAFQQIFKQRRSTGG